MLLPIREGEKDSIEYRNAVLRGIPILSAPSFIGSPLDNLTAEVTPCGTVDTVTLGNREDFLHAMRALVYRCEPVAIQDSVGAVMIRGLINRAKINEYKRCFLLAGGEDWNTEFKHFTEDKTNYQDTILLMSTGYYSAVTPEKIGLPCGLWAEKSLIIRKYHELTHFIMRAEMPDNIETLRDEIIADAVGIFAAFGRYDSRIARVFMGVDNGVFVAGGRLSHYVDETELVSAVKNTEKWINLIQDHKTDTEDPYAYLADICMMITG